MITAVDVGATKTLIAQFKGNKNPVNEVRFPTPTSTDAFLHELTTTLGHMEHPAAISIGVPGIISEHGTVLRCGNLPWRKFPLGQIMEQTYRCPVFVENDAKLAALSEINALAPVPLTGLYLTVSTGIGSGIIIDGKLLPHFRNSEAGHMVLPTPKGLQAWEDIASGAALKEHFGILAKDLTKKSQWQWLADGLALGLNALIPAVQPEVIVFGGGVGHYFKDFGPLLTRRLKNTLPTYIPVPKLVGAKHPDEAVIYGCFYYATHRQS